MTQEQVIDLGMQNQEAPIDTPVNIQSNNVAPAESPTMAPAEKMFTQSQLQAIAAKEARKAEERAESKLRAEYESKYAQNTQQPSNAQSIGGMSQLPVEEIQRIIRKEALNMSYEHKALQMEQDWKSSMNEEMQRDPEFADLYEAIGIEAQPGLIIAMAGMDNKAQVVKDLAKNPSKYANILTLANGGSPKLAQIELNKLSASIKANEKAKEQPKVDAPLSQPKASNIGGDDGNFSVTDYRNQPWLRG